MGSTVLQVFRREVTFEFGVEGEGEDGDMVEEFHLPKSSISKPPSLDISKIWVMVMGVTMTYLCKVFLG